MIVNGTQYTGPRKRKPPSTFEAAIRCLGLTNPIELRYRDGKVHHGVLCRTNGKLLLVAHKRATLGHIVRPADLAEIRHANRHKEPIWTSH